ncbi:MAG: ABC transporter permease [Defluviitaleaceae bacterium]|nr:ABC transporter permease [Defluviitaleaceae bacterium]
MTRRFALHSVTKKFYLGLVLFFLYAPIFVLMVFSFNESRSRANWEGFTLDWYRVLLNDPAIARALRNTLLVAIFSTAIATTIGTFAAVGIDKLTRRARTLVMGISRIPVMMPDIVTGLSLMVLYLFVIRTFGFGRMGFGTLLISHVMFNVPYVILSVTPRLRRIDPNLYEAALDLGSTPIRAFFKVILPELMPGVFTGALLAFTLSVDDFMVSFFTTGVGVQNLSTYIFSQARMGVSPHINALSTLMFLAILALMFVIHKRDKIHAKRMKERMDVI